MLRAQRLFTQKKWISSRVFPVKMECNCAAYSTICHSSGAVSTYHLNPSRTSYQDTEVVSSYPLSPFRIKPALKRQLRNLSLSSAIPEPHVKTDISTNHDSNDTEDMRSLYYALRSVSTFMPLKLIEAAANRNKAAASSAWRTADSLKIYSDSSKGGGGGASYSRSATLHLEYDSDDDDYENNENDHHHQDGTTDHDYQRQSTVQTAITTSHSVATTDDELHEDSRISIARQMDMAARRTVPASMRPLPSALEKSFETTKTNSNTEELNAIIKDLEEQLICAIRGKRVKLSMQLFETATVQHHVDLDLKTVFALYDLVSHDIYPFHTYQLMHYLLRRTQCALSLQRPMEERQTKMEESLQDTAGEGDSSDEPSDADMLGHLFERMVYSLRRLDPSRHLHGDIRSLVSTVTSELQQLDPGIHRRCLPVLVESLLIQRSSSIGKWAGYFYHHMAFSKYDLPPEYFQQLLIHSSFNRSQDIPFHDALQQSIQGGLRPAPNVVLSSVENMFPYSDNIRGTYTALQSVVTLQQQSNEHKAGREIHKAEMQQKLAGLDISSEEAQRLEERLREHKRIREYIFDESSLEYMAAAAAKKNHVELILLIWDALDVMGLEPSASLYENTILCFAKNVNLIENAFVVLNDMESAGFSPSPALVKGAALAIRIDRNSLEAALGLFEAFHDKEADFTFNTTALNVLMSAFSWKADVKNCISLLDRSLKHDLNVDTDAFSFALESVGKATKKLNNNRAKMSDYRYQSILDEFADAADRILTLFEKAKDKSGNALLPNHHFVQNYVEFLCSLGQVETATLVLTDFLAKYDETGAKIVDNKTLARVAVANAEAGDIEMARKCLASMSESLPYLEKKVDQLEAATLRSELPYSD